MVTPDSHQYFIVLVDIEDYSPRPDAVQVALHDAVHEVTTFALVQRAGVTPSGHRFTDRGDGMLVLLPPTVSPTLLLREMVRGLDDALVEHNQKHAPDYRMRLRVGLHHGPVVRKGKLWTGSAVNDLARLVDADPVRKVLKAAKRAHFTLVLPEALHEATVRGRFPGIDPAAYLPFDFVTKHQEERRGWITVPGYAAPPGLARPGEPGTKGTGRRGGGRGPDTPGGPDGDDGAGDDGAGGEGAAPPAVPARDVLPGGLASPPHARNGRGEAGDLHVRVEGGDYVAGAKVGGDQVHGDKRITVHAKGPVRL
ncbi:hypothetical protein [Actinacidiphila reveromycinica]|uniref:hypothetical protein n=1 Tax=Actinacidiphila reveromycinica TaxID=659352 RepID=UPI001922F241|nr:hypothetical protein [Streptomyces sp. SN-593]